MGGGVGLKSVGTLLALQKHFKHDPNDYPPPFQSLFSSIHWRVEEALYTFAVVIHVYIVGSEEGALADCKGCGEGGGGASNPSQRDPFINLGHGWPGCLQQASHWSCGCYKI